MKKIKKVFFTIFIFGISISFFIACSEDRDYKCEDYDNLPTTDFVSYEKAASISDIVCNFINKNDVPCVQISIVDSLGEIWTKSFGNTDIDRAVELSNANTFRVASITKSIVATVIFKLSEEGKLNLNDKISKYFDVLERFDDINIYNLLNHSSGLRELYTYPNLLFVSASNPAKIWNPYELADMVLNSITMFDVNAKHEYCNSNYLLLGIIAEKASNKRFDELLSEMLSEHNINNTFFAPIQTSNTLICGYDRQFFFDREKYTHFPEYTSLASAAYCSGNIVSNSGDIAKFFHLLFNNKILSEQSLDIMKTCYSADSDNEHISSFCNGVISFEFDDDDYFGHDGNIVGFESIVLYSPKDKFTLTILINKSDKLIEEITEQILDVL
ncbi:MAG: serine hydrolase [Lentimicrobiaceae bacterium]|nr:serine hydrolase [Lentimicrobiaceae bacterium]